MIEQRGLGLDSGYIHDWTYNTLVAVLGATGRTWGEMAEIADSQVEKYDSDFYMAADNMAGVLMEDYIQRPLARYIVRCGEAGEATRYACEQSRVRNRRCAGTHCRCDARAASRCR